MAKKIKVLIADDTLIAREGWSRILETAGDMEVVGAAATASETVRLCRDQKPDILLIDLQWFGDESAGWRAIREIKQKQSIKIIAVTAYENLIKNARMAGADSALLKTFSRDELLSEIREQYARPKEDLDIPVLVAPHENDILTKREIQVLKLLSDGHSNKEIANILGITLPTTKNHVKNILAKLNVKSRLQAVNLGRQQNLLN